MRIIAGALKGRRLRAPTWQGLRPSSGRLRETLFNVLGGQVKGAIVLDGCAGTGALGIEAISRGADRVVFIDHDARAIRLVTENAAKCGIINQCRIVRGVLPKTLGRVGLPAEFNLIVLDPNYEDPRIDTILFAVGARLTLEGLLVLERSKRTTPLTVSNLVHVRRVASGDSVLDFYQRVQEDRNDIA